MSRNHIITELTEDELARFPRTLRYENVDGDCRLWLVSWSLLPSGRVDMMAAGPFTRDDAEQLSDSGEMGRLVPENADVSLPKLLAMARNGYVEPEPETGDEPLAPFAKLKEPLSFGHALGFPSILVDHERAEPEPESESESESEPDSDSESEPLLTEYARKRPGAPWRRSNHGKWFGPLPVGPRPVGWALDAHIAQRPFIVLDVEANLLEALLNEIDENHSQSISLSHCIALPVDASKPFGSEPNILVVCYCVPYLTRQGTQGPPTL